MKHQDKRIIQPNLSGHPLFIVHIELTQNEIKHFVSYTLCGQ